ncbi:type I restriction enzyme HsdR N-terminal domain-containing protein [Marivirga sp. S37H4]|uniref:Type I restriction enzyme HsdR N-terminal domain-containing protein n=1 Tax=Marivirga aurantiaca TaxID=2802615 RepID=A0A935C9L6_9BACT|nr:type I restriction enzyme HsdR N-terminal domain-containing protein [Marivirga aurantiaca]MBK6266110.1 type I restriction enzyme HsdR N-terminal domain-containing protein [Marivirga aurantiaca]
MERLNLPPYEPDLQKLDGKIHIFDPIRKKYLVLSPEEWVRQHFLNFLVHHKGYSASLISMETGLKYHERQKRTDLIAYGPNMVPLLLVECKAPEIKITQKSFAQISSYFSKVKAKYMLLTNGKEHFCFRPDEKELKFEASIPDYQQAING